MPLPPAFDLIPLKGAIGPSYAVLGYPSDVEAYEVVRHYQETVEGLDPAEAWEVYDVFGVERGYYRWEKEDGTKATGEDDGDLWVKHDDGEPCVMVRL